MKFIVVLVWVFYMMFCAIDFFFLGMIDEGDEDKEEED